MSHKYHLGGTVPVNGFKLVFQYHPKPIKSVHPMPNCVAFSLLSLKHSICSDAWKQSQTVDKNTSNSSFVIQGENDWPRTASLNLSCTHCYTWLGLLQTSCCSESCSAIYHALPKPSCSHGHCTHFPPHESSQDKWTARAALLFFLLLGFSVSY